MQSEIKNTVEEKKQEEKGMGLGQKIAAGLVLAAILYIAVMAVIKKFF